MLHFPLHFSRMKACAGRLQIRDRPKIISSDAFPVDPGTPPGPRPGFRPGKAPRASPAAAGEVAEPGLGPGEVEGGKSMRAAALRGASHRPLSPLRGQLPGKRGGRETQAWP